VSYGDVVGATSVVDIEGGRAEPKRFRPRYETYRLRAPIRQMFMSFSPDRWGWLEGREECLELLRNTGSKVPEAAIRKMPSYEKGFICSGEKLRRDGTLPDMAREYHDQILAVEMEGSGFASTCDNREVSWLVLRGISDYADMRKRDSWQAVATLHAALAAKAFLVHGLRPLDETQF